MTSSPVSVSPSQGAHRALTYPDVILEIIEKVSPADATSAAGYIHRKLLATLSLVCKTFSVPATKALWRRLDSFFPLMTLFSAFQHHKSSLNSPDIYVRSSYYIRPPILLFLIATQR